DDSPVTREKKKRRNHIKGFSAGGKALREDSAVVCWCFFDVVRSCRRNDLREDEPSQGSSPISGDLGLGQVSDL
ncbi:hypothetical protein U1Q18_043159, partial [Sarracenia purpurea var. burkii]